LTQRQCQGEAVETVQILGVVRGPLVPLIDLGRQGIDPLVEGERLGVVPRYLVVALPDPFARSMMAAGTQGPSGR